ncbi:UPF0149 family protein [Providencia rettgeri]|uniref:UPF0149 family protein n=1 Tax=Providencia rettgeri TaxID=587 RepID=UPI0030176A1C
MNIMPDTLIEEHELNALDDLLEKFDSPFNVEGVDGFFTALICSPDLIKPSQYLPMILDGYEFTSQKEAEVFFDLLMRLWNSIAISLRWFSDSGLLEYEPLFCDYEDINITGRFWAMGFMSGVSCSPEHWEPLLDERNPYNLMTPIVLLASEQFDDFPEKLKVSDSIRDDILALIGINTLEIYDYFEFERMQLIPSKKTKVGRNDPCPCDSGKKFKRCCASKLRLVK